jgi:hypothetical protein
MVSLLRLLNIMAFLSDNFRYSVFKKESNVEIFMKSSIFSHVEIAYVFTIGLLSYLIYSHDFSRISSNITFHMYTCGKWTYEKLDRKHFPEYCDL